jgi:hypothetical protein
MRDLPSDRRGSRAANLWRWFAGLWRRVRGASSGDGGSSPAAGGKIGEDRKRVAPDPEWPVRPIGRCREGMTVCLACLDRNLSMPEQVALLLVDVFDFGEHRAAARLRMPPARFHVLLNRSRVHLLRTAAHPCALIRDPEPPAPATWWMDPADDLSRSENLRDRFDSTAVWCGIDDEGLHALRKDLVRRLGRRG